MSRIEKAWDVTALSMSTFTFTVLLVKLVPSASGQVELGLLLMGGVILLCCMSVFVFRLILNPEES